MRIFKAFASLGFDDDGWWSDADLDLAAKKGEADVASLRAAVQSLEAQLDVLKTGEGSKKELRQIEDQLKEKRPALTSTEADLQPLLIELRERGLRPPAG